jgi:hypothetical protein
VATLPRGRPLPSSSPPSSSLHPETPGGSGPIGGSRAALLISQATQGRLLKPRPPSGFYGVYTKGKRWTAQIHYDSKKHNLGTFDTKQEAALAYSWIPYNSGIRQSGPTPSILHYNWFCNHIC